MGVFNDLGKKLSKSSQDAVKKAKEFKDITKLNSQISDEKRLINDCYRSIGEKYYKEYGSQPIEEFVELCNNITISNEKIEKLNEEIVKIKNIQICPKCGAECHGEASFCETCGEPLVKKEETEIVVETTEEIESIAEKTCSNCGQKLGDNDLYCSVCGTKQE